jgi:hypothetical protein
MLVLSFYLVDMLLKQILEQEVDLSGHWGGGRGFLGCQKHTVTKSALLVL